MRMTVPQMDRCNAETVSVASMILMTSLENFHVKWVEDGVAPGRIVASRTGRNHPLCAKVAKYTGKGGTDDTADYTCAMQ